MSDIVRTTSRLHAASVGPSFAACVLAASAVIRTDLTLADTFSTLLLAGVLVAGSMAFTHAATRAGRTPDGLIGTEAAWWAATMRWAAGLTTLALTTVWTISARPEIAGLVSFVLALILGVVFGATALTRARPTTQHTVITTVSLLLAIAALHLTGPDDVLPFVLVNIVLGAGCAAIGARALPRRAA